MTESVSQQRRKEEPVDKDAKPKKPSGTYFMFNKMKKKEMMDSGEFEKLISKKKGDGKITWSKFTSKEWNLLKSTPSRAAELDAIREKYKKEAEEYKDLIDPHRYRLAAWGGMPRYDATLTRQHIKAEQAKRRQMP